MLDANEILVASHDQADTQLLLDNAHVLKFLRRGGSCGDPSPNLPSLLQCLGRDFLALTVASFATVEVMAQ